MPWPARRSDFRMQPKNIPARFPGGTARAMVVQDQEAAAVHGLVALSTKAIVMVPRTHTPLIHRGPELSRNFAVIDHIFRVGTSRRQGFACEMNRASSGTEYPCRNE
jgi:hypothetical protein